MSFFLTLLFALTPSMTYSSPCKKFAEKIYFLKAKNFHRLCLMNEFSRAPAKFVFECKKNPKKYFFRNKKLMFSEIENQTLCTDKFILLTCKKNKGFYKGPKYNECLRVEKKYKKQKF